MGAIVVGCSGEASAPGDRDSSTAQDGGEDAALPPDATPPPDAGADSGPASTIGAGPYAIVYSSGPGIGIDSRTNVTAAFTGMGTDGYTASAMEAPTGGTAGVAEAAMDAFSAVGRWSGGTSAGTYYTSPPFTWGAQQGFHYGLVIAAGAFPVNVGVPYALTSATKPTIEDGSLAPGSATAKATVAYGANGATERKLGLEITVTMPGDATYTATTAGGAATPATSALSTFNASHAGDLAVTGGGVACSGASVCKMNVRAMIGGGGASPGARVAIAYVLTSGAPEKALHGVVMLESR